MKKTILVEGKQTTLDELAPGSLFKFDNRFVFKSEYRGLGGVCQCYILNSGEMFWGGTDTASSLNKLVVTEFKLVEEDTTELVDNIPYVPFPIAFHTVDVIAVRDVDGDMEFLLGRKPNQDKWQFVGGFVEPTHTAEHTAAKEFNEEANVLITDEYRFKYIGSAYIQDSRYKDSCHKITSTVFVISLNITEANSVKAGDDLEEVGWFKMENVFPNLREQHREIFTKALIRFLRVTE